jgi:hypothetical protein
MADFFRSETAKASIKISNESARQVNCASTFAAFKLPKTLNRGPEVVCKNALYE